MLQSGVAKRRTCLETEQQNAYQGPGTMLSEACRVFRSIFTVPRHYCDFTDKHTEAGRSTSIAQMVLFWIPHCHRPRTAFQGVLTMMPTGGIF